MATKTFARIQDGVVAELFATDADITQLFAPALVWVDVTGAPSVLQGWRYDGSDFTPPPPVVVVAPPAPSLADLQAQLQALAAQIAALTKS
jgi:hypothetical protein